MNIFVNTPILILVFIVGSIFAYFATILLSSSDKIPSENESEPKSQNLDWKRHRGLGGVLAFAALNVALGLVAIFVIVAVSHPE